MRTFKEVRKNKKKDFSGLKEKKIAILSDQTTQYFAQSLRGLGYEYSIDAEIYEGAYDQTDIEIIDEDSEFYKFQPEYTVILFTALNLKQRLYARNLDERKAFVEEELSRIKMILDRISINSNTKILLSNYSEQDDGVWGNYAGVYENSLLFVIREINGGISRIISERQGVYMLDISKLQNIYDEQKIFDNRFYYLTSSAFAADFWVRISEEFYSVAGIIEGKIKKCIITDLDNTVWGGVVGDDGVDNIVIGGTPEGKAFADIQSWLKELARRGIAVCVCSKNDENNARQPFTQRPDMVLSLDDISVFIANWDDKAKNIMKIKEILNIGYDSMVFLDDNPFERELVSAVLPDILVPQLPENVVSIPGFLYKSNWFETVNVSEEDKKRTEGYRQEVKRVQLKENFDKIEDFLRDLNMKYEFRETDEYTLDRTAQLTQRTNQFNLSTNRYTEKDLASTNNDDSYHICAVSLEDRMGDYGIIGAFILKYEKDSVVIDSMLLSCRVFKRGVDDLMMNTIVEIAGKKKIKQIKAKYVESQKNGLVKDFLEKKGFKPDDEDMWVVNTDDYTPTSVFIEEKE